MNTTLMFSKQSDLWSTPQAFFDALNAEFKFQVDVAATAENAKCMKWFGPGSRTEDALAVNWPTGGALWLNPPYSQCRQFMAKAAASALRGCTTVCLVPSRTDTKWWHEHVWAASHHSPRPGVQVRFVRGRLKFGNTGDCKNSAPFPSVVIVFRPYGDTDEEHGACVVIRGPVASTSDAAGGQR